MDVFGGEIRRRDVFPLLVLHLIAREPAYGNRLIEEIEGITEGVISANPNTIYPLLRELEARGLIEGSWEHPDRRTPPLLLDHPTRATGVRAPAHRARAVPRLGDPLGDADQARDLPRERGLRLGAGRGLAGRDVGLLLRPARLARLGRRLRPRVGDRRLPRGGRDAALALDPGRARRGHRAVLEHEPRRLHRVAFTDPESGGRADHHLRDRGGRDAASRSGSTTGCAAAGRSGGSPTGCSSAPSCGARWSARSSA